MKKVKGVLGFKKELPRNYRKGFFDGLRAFFFETGEIVQAGQPEMSYNDLYKAMLSNDAVLLWNKRMTVMEYLGYGPK